MTSPQIDDNRDRDAGLAIVISETAEDREWDDFLLASPVGYFLQTGMWAQTKAAEGWRPLRLLLRRSRIVAGAQVLWKERYGVRYGFVIKGPVPEDDTDAAAAEIVERLAELAAKRRLALLLVKPPDAGSRIPQALGARPFLPNHLHAVISANLVVDLSPGWDAVEKRFRRTMRQEVRHADKTGVKIREGGAEDLATFHELMTDTCRRLRVKPNPSAVATFLAMWQAMEPRKNIRLTLAEQGGQPIAGLLSVAFGQSLTFWKKGSNAAGRSCHADKALFYEGIAWACRNGFARCDFASMSPETARALLRGEPLPEEAKRTRDFLHLGYGGTPVLLPESRILLPNALFRAVYLVLGRFRHGRTLLGRIGCAA